MLYPEKKERENRFKLALRMGLPIFFLGILLLFSFTNEMLSHLTISFFIVSLLILSIMVYFFLYMIYIGFDERITDPITHTFTREYIYALFKKEIAKKDYSIVLISIDNLHYINEKYGIKNGDKVLYETVLQIHDFFTSKNIKNFPIGHLKGGDLLIGLEGKKEKYRDFLEFICLKISNYKINDIEVNTNISILDNSFSKNLDYIIDHLFQLQKLKKSSRNLLLSEDEDVDPDSLELSIIDAIKYGKFTIFGQGVYDKNSKLIMQDLSVKLKVNKKFVHQKTFMPVINRLGLSYEYDAMLLNEIAIKLSKNKNRYALSISPTTLRNPHFIPYLKGLRDTYPDIQKRLTFIICEVEYYSRIENFNTLIQEIRTMGIFIAIDRFFEYHTSFLYFREIEIDMIRFDAKYTKHLDISRYKTIIKGSHATLSELGINSWMRMIENEITYMRAKNIGINMIQGKHLDNLKEI